MRVILDNFCMKISDCCASRISVAAQSLLSDNAGESCSDYARYYVLGYVFCAKEVYASNSDPLRRLEFRTSTAFFGHHACFQLMSNSRLQTLEVDTYFLKQMYPVWQYETMNTLREPMITLFSKYLGKCQAAFKTFNLSHTLKWFVQHQLDQFSDIELGLFRQLDLSFNVMWYKS